MGLTHGIHTISLYDHQGNNKVVQLNALVPDQSTFNLRQQNEGPTTPQGNRYNAGLMSEVDFVFLDVDGVAGSIETWQSNDTPVRLVAAGANKNILWEEDTIPNIQPIEIEGAVGGRSDAYRVQMTHRTGRGDTHDIWGLANLLAKLGTRADSWVDNDGDGLADGYSLNSTANSTSFSNNEQTISDDADSQFFVVNVQFPISGVTFTFSNRYVSLHGSADDEIQLLEKDSSGTVLSKINNTVTSTGRKSVSLTTSSNIYELNVSVVRFLNVTASGSTTVKLPALRTDGKTTHLNG